MKTLLSGFFPATAMPDPDWWEALWPDPAQVLSSLGIEPDMEVVDLCCGDGLFTAPLARMTRHVIAVDLDPAMLDKARAALDDVDGELAFAKRALQIGREPPACRVNLLR